MTCFGLLRRVPDHTDFANFPRNHIAHGAVSQMTGFFLETSAWYVWRVDRTHQTQVAVLARTVFRSSGSPRSVSSIVRTDSVTVFSCTSRIDRADLLIVAFTHRERRPNDPLSLLGVNSSPLDSAIGAPSILTRMPM